MALQERLHDNRYLLFALGALLVVSNIPYGQYILYPFELFSTWIHETCHGLASLGVGGIFKSLYIFPDTSGKAYLAYVPGAINSTIVSSAGYIGTTLFGALLLLLQRPTRYSKGVAALSMFILLVIMLWQVKSITGVALYLGIIALIGVLAFLTPVDEVGRVGTFCFGVLMLVTILYSRNLFGLVFLAVMGGGLVVIGMRMPKDIGAMVFSFLAATCGLNALTSIKVLFSANRVINGQPAAGQSDAHAVANALFGPYYIWASLWMVFSVIILGGALMRALSAPTLVLKELEEPNSPRPRGTTPS